MYVIIISPSNNSNVYVMPSITYEAFKASINFKDHPINCIDTIRIFFFFLAILCTETTVMHYVLKHTSKVDSPINSSSPLSL